MGALSTRILWVGASDPWSPWTLSGISQAICNELSRRDLLLGAIWPDGLSLRHMRRPGPLYCLEHELLKRARRHFPRREWHDESKGLLGRALRLCPPNTRVIYALVRPHVLDL